MRVLLSCVVWRVYTVHRRTYLRYESKRSLFYISNKFPVEKFKRITKKNQSAFPANVYIPGTCLGWTRLNLYHTPCIFDRTLDDCITQQTAAAVKRRRRAQTSPRTHTPLYSYRRVQESSHGRGAAIFADLLTWGAQYLTRNMTSKKFVRATAPTFLCTSPKTIILVKLSHKPGVPYVRSSTAHKQLRQKV